jgi:tetratricopeptide (TPR) repeat protein
VIAERARRGRWPRLVAGAALALWATACGTPARPAARPRPRAELPPVDPLAQRRFDAGVEAMAGGDPAGRARAKEAFRAAVERDGKLWEAWHNLGVIAFADGDDRAAAEALSRALAINPAHAPSRVARAEAYRRAGRIDPARADYERALTEDPEDRATAARLASLLRETRRYDDALDRIRETLRVVGPSAEIYVELALIYLAQGRQELADLVLRKAAQLDAEVPAIHNAMALLALERGDAQLAFESFDRATSLDPHYQAARFNKASVLLDAGDYASARRELELVVGSGNGEREVDFAALVALGVACRGLGELAEARARWESVVRDAPIHDPARADALFDLAVLALDFEQDEKQAAAALDRYLSEAPTDHPKRQEAAERRKEIAP